MRVRALVPTSHRASLKALLHGRQIGLQVHYVGNGEGWDRRPGDVNLVMGKELFERIRPKLPVKKNASLTSCRERVFRFKRGDCYLFTYDPFIAWIEPDIKVDWQWDIRLLQRYLKTGTVDPIVGKYRFVEDFDAEVAYLGKKIAAGVTPAVSVDTETQGSDPWSPQGRLLTVQVAVRDGSASVYRVPPEGFPSTRVHKQLTWICSEPRLRVCGASGKYDENWLTVRWGIEFQNYAFDTHLVGSLLDENRSNALEIHAKLMTNMGGYDVEFNRLYDKANMAEPLEKDPKRFLVYAGGDPDACRQVTRVMRRRLAQDYRLQRFYDRILLPSSRVFAKMERRGVLVDDERYKQLKSEVTAKVKELQTEVLGRLPAKVRQDFKDNLTIREVVLRAAFFSKRGFGLKPKMLTKKTKKATTKLDHIRMFEDERPELGELIDALEAHGRAKKALTTYINGFRKFIRSDGRFHPSYRLGRGQSQDEVSGTVTGRTSATEPAYQTIPKRNEWAKPLRSVYVAPPGYGIFKLDMNQGELRFAACLANEPVMLDAYRRNLDLHALTAASMMHISDAKFLALPEETRDSGRRAAKAVNFGLIYRIGPDGLREYSRTAYGVKITLAESEAYMEAFFGRYRKLPTWHEKMIQLARRHGHVRNPFGRIRHLPMILHPLREISSKQERQAINSPVQSGLSDLVQLAMVEIDQARPDIWIFGNTHDSLEFYLKLETFWEDARQIKEIAENLPLDEFDWHPQIPFLTDAEYTLEGTLADVEKVKL